MPLYETTFILTPDLEEADLEKNIERYIHIYALADYDGEDYRNKTEIFLNHTEAKHMAKGGWEK